MVEEAQRQGEDSEHRLIQWLFGAIAGALLDAQSTLVKAQNRLDVLTKLVDRKVP